MISHWIRFWGWFNALHIKVRHYGEEVAAGMLEHPQSVVYRQAHNRLHGQKALLEFIFSGN